MSGFGDVPRVAGVQRDERVGPALMPPVQLIEALDRIEDVQAVLADDIQSGVVYVGRRQPGQ